MNETLIALGLFTDHLVSISPGLLVDPDASRAFTALSRRAASEGFDLRPASAFRDYDRQAQIVNEKWSGNRPVEDEAGRPIGGPLSDAQWLAWRHFAIFRAAGYFPTSLGYRFGYLGCCSRRARLRTQTVARRVRPLMVSSLR